VTFCYGWIKSIYITIPSFIVIKTQRRSLLFIYSNNHHSTWNMFFLIIIILFYFLCAAHIFIKTCLFPVCINIWSKCIIMIQFIAKICILNSHKISKITALNNFNGSTKKIFSLFKGRKIALKHNFCTKR
jgi:hypothetical protein